MKTHILYLAIIAVLAAPTFAGTWNDEPIMGLVMWRPFCKPVLGANPPLSGMDLTAYKACVNSQAAADKETMAERIDAGVERWVYWAENGAFPTN